ncbi:flagellar FlbD family protein [Ammoniphilus sp. YIM 78166]|uniref:flagellar FlbD family protein n=1 Tax=Ammoniphilus sp. YIM 78166 TaxID=1644106 RepID=UPI0010701BCE|nr:flagellar FlbD family protein [Ammoniphilus sp. YIM 78166]
MIKLTRLNNSSYFLNPFLIEIIEETPDTIITLTNGKKFIVKEKALDVMVLIKEFYRDIHLLKTVGIQEVGDPNV